VSDATLRRAYVVDSAPDITPSAPLHPIISIDTKARLDVKRICLTGTFVNLVDNMVKFIANLHVKKVRSLSIIHLGFSLAPSG
jgi:hypothetical protein